MIYSGVLQGKCEVIYAEFSLSLCLDMKGKLCESSIIHLCRSPSDLQTYRWRQEHLVFSRGKRVAPISCISCHFFGFYK